MSEQEQFERYAAGRRLPLDVMIDGTYYYAATHEAWLAWQAACPEGWQCVPVEPDEAMINAGAQRLVNWACDGLMWPDSWCPVDVAAARNDAERVIRAAHLVAPKPEDV